MSQFASGQGAQIQALGALARTAGEGKKFLTKFDMEQKALGTALRAQQQQQQQQQAEADRGVQLQRLAAEQESRRFTQALQAQQQVRQGEQDAAQAELNNRRTELQLAQEARRIEEGEAQLQQGQDRIDISREQLDISREREQRLDDRTIQADVGRSLAFIGQQTKLVADINSQIADPFLPSERAQELRQLKEGITANIAFAQQQVDAAAFAKVEKMRATEKQRPVTLTEASPETQSALQAFGQTKVLPLPRENEKIEVGRVYFVPGRGSVVFVGQEAAKPFRSTADFESFRRGR